MINLISFRSIQKLRFFLAGVFPFLIRPPTKEEATFRWLARFPRLEAFFLRVRASALGTNAERVAGTFVVGNYAQDTLDWTKIPRDSTGVLRATILIGGLLCLLVPLAMSVAWPPLPAEPITGTPGGVVAGWSIVLWLIAFALGLSCFLVGTAAASRVVFLPSLVLYLYFSVAVVAAAPKSWWNLLVPLVASIATVFGETRSRHSGRSDVVRGILTCVLAGCAIGFVTIVVPPTPPWFRGRLTMATILVGVPLGIGLWAVGRRLRSRAVTPEHDPPRPVLRLDTVAGILSVLYLAMLVSLAVRAGLTAPAGGIQSFSVQMTGYLWPLYFFIGVGVVFKVLRQAKAVHGVVHELVPAQLLIPGAFVLLVIATIIPWIDPILLTPAFPWPRWVVAAAEWVYTASAWIWARPLARFTMETMKWVLLAALLSASWALYRRRLTSGMMAGLLFTVTLVGLGVTEYHFELMGFARSPRNSALSLLVFTVFVLWLAHRTMLRFLVGSSTWWPPSARVAVYGAALIFVLLPIHARAALHNASLTNEIFLYLFSGVINFGLPYYLFVYATKRFKRLPLSIPAVLGTFCLGALLSVPLVVLDKMVLAGGSLSGAWAIATAQTNAMLTGQEYVVPATFLPPLWLAVRGVLAISAVLVTGLLATRRVADPSLRMAATAFSIIGVAAGLACLSNRSLELPLLPNRIVQLIMPLHVSVTIDAALVARQLSFLVPALLLALTLIGDRPPAARRAGIGAAFAVHIGIGLLWPAQEAWLRSTGALFSVGAAGIALFFLLAGALRDRLEHVLVPTAGSEPNVFTTTPPVSWNELRWVTGAGLLVLAAWTAYSAYAGRLLDRDVAGVAVKAGVPAAWRQDTATVGGRTVLTGHSWSGTEPSLWTDVRPYAKDSTRLLLQGVAMETAGILRDYEPLKLERWDQFFPGALVLDFRFNAKEGDPDTVKLGTTVLAPLAGGKALLVTATYGTGDPVRRWDLARTLLALPR